MSESPYRISKKTAEILRRLAKELAPSDVFKITELSPVRNSSSDSDCILTFLRHLKANRYLLATLYQLCISREQQFQFGITYTPPDLALEAAQRTARYLTGDALAILDPACGGGILLKSLADELGARVTSATGMDTDEHAADLTNFLFSRPSFSFQTLTCDALSAPTCPAYDAIIMNPPYGTFRDKPNLDNSKTSLKNTFGVSAGGKLNLYMAFVLHHISALKEDGVLTAIVPNSWLGIDDGAAFREALIHKRLIREIKINSADAFTQIGAETLILVLKNSPCDSFFVHFPDESVRQIYYSELSSDSRISLSHGSSILEELSATKPLSHYKDLFEPRIALQAYRLGGGTPPQSAEVVKGHPFHSTVARVNSIKYLEGRDVKRYSLGWSGSFLDYGPWLAECPPLSRFSGQRIVVREILGALPHIVQATLVSDDAVYNRSILQIKLLDPSRSIELLTLLGYLNSSIISLHILQRGRKAQRALFPKLVIADLKELPIPDCLWDHQHLIAEKVQARLLSDEPSQFSNLDRIINETVAGALGMRHRLPEILREITKIGNRLGIRETQTAKFETAIEIST